MKAETVIHSRLTSYAGLTNIIGQRVYPVALPQAPAYPCVSYRRISSRRVEGVHEQGGYAYATIQINLFAQTYEDIKNLAEQLRLALDRYGSAVTGTVIAGVTVYDIVLGSEVDAYEPSIDVFSHAIDFEILHAE